MGKETLKPFPSCLRKYRKMNGFKQREVAQLLGLKNSSIISLWEQGKRFPSAMNLLKLSVLYWTLPDAFYPDQVRAMRKKLHAATLRQRAQPSEETAHSRTPRRSLKA